MRKILLLLAIFFLTACTSLDDVELKVAPDFPDVPENLMALFEPVAEGYDLRLLDKGHVWWIDEDDYSILIPTKKSLVVSRTYTKGEGVNESFLKAYFQREMTIVREAFSEWGFTFNERNSSENSYDDQFYDYVQAYERGEELCTVTVSGDISSAYYFGEEKGRTANAFIVACTNELARYQEEQIPFIDALGIREDDRVATVSAQSGDFFKISVRWRRTGLAAILKKEGDEYHVLYKGQEAPLCSLIDEEGIPSEVLKGIGDGDCFSEEGERIVR